MKDQYKINTRRYLSLKKRDTYGISANDLLIVKQLTKSLLIISTIKRLMIKRGILTEDKRSKLKKVHALILHRIDCQLIVDKSHVLGGLKMKYRPYKFTDLTVRILVDCLDSDHLLIFRDCTMASDYQIM
jgi:hypothetical protein